MSLFGARYATFTSVLKRLSPASKVVTDRGPAGLPGRRHHLFVTPVFVLLTGSELPVLLWTVTLTAVTRQSPAAPAGGVVTETAPSQIPALSRAVAVTARPALARGDVLVVMSGPRGRRRTGARPPLPLSPLPRCPCRWRRPSGSPTLRSGSRRLPRSPSVGDQPAWRSSWTPVGPAPQPTGRRPRARRSWRARHLRRRYRSRPRVRPGRPHCSGRRRSRRRRNRGTTASPAWPS